MTIVTVKSDKSRVLGRRFWPGTCVEDVAGVRTDEPEQFSWVALMKGQWRLQLFPQENEAGNICFCHRVFYHSHVPHRVESTSDGQKVRCALKLSRRVESHFQSGR